MIAILFLSLVLQTSCDPNDPTLCAMPISKGTPAPFTGTLMTPELAIKLSQKAADCDPRQTLDLQRQVADMNVSLESCQGQLDRDMADVTRMGELADAAAQKCQHELDACEPPFWLKPWVVGPVAFILGGAAIGYIVTR